MDKNHRDGTGGVTPAVEYLLCKHKVQRSNPRHAYKKNHRDESKCCVAYIVTLYYIGHNMVTV
jgi:hypothetical protein